MLYEQLKKRKKELGITTEQLSRLSGIPIGTINKILNGETRSPRYDTLKALENVLFDDADNTKRNIDSVSDSATVCQTQAERKKQGGYTLVDYYALPDERHTELIDGCFYDMASPTSTHQDILLALAFEFELYIRSNKGSCKVLVAPLDVQLDMDDRTIVQPDIVVVCKKEIIMEQKIFGAPDLCIEIVSDSTRKLDYGLKNSKYMNAGVREYWIVDAKREKVVCYNFEGEDYPVIYSFDDIVPVHIYDAKLEIDFSQIKERLL